MKSLCPSNRRSGLTLIELLVVVAIIAILVAVLLPILRTAGQYAHRGVCISNLKQVWYATQMSADDNGSYLPEVHVVYLRDDEGRVWPDPGSLTRTLEPYLAANSPVWHCRGDTAPRPKDDLNPHPSELSYSVSPDPMGKEQAAVPNPSYVIWAADGYVDPDTGACQPLFNHPDYNGKPKPKADETGPGQVAYRHFDGAVFLFCDGHVDWVPRWEIEFWQWDYEGRRGAPVWLH